MEKSFSVGAGEWKSIEIFILSMLLNVSGKAFCFNCENELNSNWISMNILFAMFIEFILFVLNIRFFSFVRIHFSFSLFFRNWNVFSFQISWISKISNTQNGSGYENDSQHNNFQWIFHKNSFRPRKWKRIDSKYLLNPLLRVEVWTRSSLRLLGCVNSFVFFCFSHGWICVICFFFSSSFIVSLFVFILSSARFHLWFKIKIHDLAAHLCSSTRNWAKCECRKSNSNTNRKRRRIEVCSCCVRAVLKIERNKK